MATFKRSFRVPLSLEDKAKKADELSSVVRDIDEIEADRSAFSKACNDKLKVLHSKLTELGRTVREGDEERLVECEWRPHPDRPFMELYRLDTAEKIEERPMTEAEAQGDFRFSNEAPELPGEVDDEQDDDDLDAGGEPSEDEAPPLPKCPFVVRLDPMNGAVIDRCDRDGSRRANGLCAEHAAIVTDRAERMKLSKEARLERAAAKSRQNGIPEAASAADAADELAEL